jgi:hypothetical protein
MSDQLVCDDGFRLIGDDVRRCRSNLTWSGFQPSCIVITCQDLPQIANGQQSTTITEPTVNMSPNILPLDIIRPGVSHSIAEQDGGGADHSPVFVQISSSVP